MEQSFRALTIGENRMVTGNLTILREGRQGSGCYISNANGSPFAFKVNPETVGQYTGISNLFEGDICKSKTIHGKLFLIEKRIDPEFIGFIPKEVGTNNLSHFVRWDDLEVIGNKFENPELLDPQT